MRPSRFFWGTLLLTLGCSGLAAQPAREAGKEAVRDPRASASRTAKGPLPDPALLDGSTLEPEKRPEHGMLGEFEMPGDENAKSDRVGQSSEQPPQGTGGGGQGAGPQSQNAAKSGGMPSGGGAPSQAQQSSQGQQGGGGSAGAESQSAQNGSAGGKSDSQGGASGSADGMQVASISGAAGQAGSAPSTKPQQVALGDSAMQIKQQGGAAPNVVGAQQLPQGGKDVPQQYDGKTPSGGKQSGAGRGNQGVEKGRVMPAGI